MFHKESFPDEKILKTNLAVVVEDKHEDENMKRLNLIGDVTGQTCIIVDDIVDSGKTLIQVAETLKNNGAKKVYA